MVWTLDGEDMLIITDDKINKQCMLYLCDVKIVFFFFQEYLSVMVGA